MDELERLQRRLIRERAARKEAEQLLEEKSRELFLANRELKAVAERLDLARLEALTENRAKSEFLAHMSHELRTPLNAIIGYSQLLMEEATDRNETHMLTDLKRIETAGNYLLELINKVLDLSKIEAGRIELVWDEVDLVQVVDSVIELLPPLLDAHKNQFYYDRPRKPILIVSDEAKIRQILVNLLGNACKFTREGKIYLELADLQDKVKMVVRDTGVGISKQQQTRIFTPFAQANGSISQHFGGTGLGLAICAQLCKLLGGRIVVQSELGQGSTFMVDLPLRPEVEHEANL